jgi:hypothetical protein
MQYRYGCIKFKDRVDGICFVLFQKYCITKVQTQYPHRAYINYIKVLPMK